MNITIVCDVLGKENNGTTITAMNLIRSMSARGHNVNVVCSDEEKRGMPGYYIVPTLDFGPLNGYIAKNGGRAGKGGSNNPEGGDERRGYRAYHVAVFARLRGGEGRQRIGQTVYGGLPRACGKSDDASVFASFGACKPSDISGLLPPALSGLFLRALCQ